jgi:hypothetical protein
VLFTTLARASSVVSPASILGDAFNYAGPVICLSLLAVIASLKSTPRIRFLCLSAAAACLLAPAEQARIRTLTSLHILLGFGAWFAAIGAGYVIAEAGRLGKERSWRIAIAVATVLPLTLISFNVSGDLYRSWPSSAQVIAKLRPLLRSRQAHYLIEEAAAADYYLHADVYPGQVVPLSQCVWWDSTTRRELTGPSACAAAIKASYFQVIETGGSTGPPISSAGDTAAWNAISHTGRYRLVYRARQQFRPHHFFEIWQLGRGQHSRSPAPSTLTATAHAAGKPASYPIFELETWLTAALGCLIAAVCLAIRLWWRRGKSLEDV